jgi:hypothetical protein
MSDESTSNLTRILKRLSTLETDALRTRRDLDLQFQRIAQMQAQIDLMTGHSPAEAEADETGKSRSQSPRSSKRPGSGGREH